MFNLNFLRYFTGTPQEDAVAEPLLPAAAPEAVAVEAEKQPESSSSAMWEMFKAGASTAFSYGVVMPASWAVAKTDAEDDIKYLNENGDPELRSLLNTVNKTLQERIALQEKDAVKSDLIGKGVRYVLYKVMHNLFLESKKTAQYSEDSFCQMVMHLMGQVIQDIKNLEETFKGVDRKLEFYRQMDREETGLTPEEFEEVIKKKRAQLVQEALSPIVDKLLKIALPGGAAELPVRMEWLQTYIWDNYVIPYAFTFVNDWYNLVMTPKHALEIKGENPLVAALSHVLSDELKKKTPDLVEQNVGKIAAAIQKFAPLTPADNLWLKEKMSLIATNDNPEIQTILNFGENYIDNAIQHLLSHLSLKDVNFLAPALKLTKQFMDKNQAKLRELDDEFARSLKLSAQLLKRSEQEVLKDLYSPETDIPEVHLTTMRTMQQQSLELFKTLIKEVLAEGEIQPILREYPFLETALVDVGASFVLDFYRDLTWPKKNLGAYEKALERALGKQEITEGLSDEKIVQVVRNNLEIDKTIVSVKNSVAAAAKDCVSTFLKTNIIRDFLGSYLTEGNQETPIEFAKELKRLLQQVTSEKIFLDYLENSVEMILFKILAHQADQAREESLPIVEGKPLKPWLLANLADRLLEIAGEHLKALDLKEAYAALEKAETEEQRNECKKTIDAAFLSLSRALLESTLKDSRKELFAMVPEPFNGMIYQAIETSVLPDLLQRLYRQSEEFAYREEDALAEMNKIVLKHVHDHNNHIPALCNYLAQWGAAYIPVYLREKNLDLADKIKGLIPEKYLAGITFDLKGYIARNVEQIGIEAATDEPVHKTLEAIEKNIDDTLVQLFGGLMRKLDQIEYPDGVESHKLFTKILEKLITGARSHFQTIQQVSHKDGKRPYWDFRNPEMNKGFRERGKLHDAMIEENRSNYFKELTELIFSLADFKTLSVPDEGKEMGLKLLKEEVVPGILESLFDNIAKPSTINKLMLAALTIQPDLSKEVDKTELTVILGQIQNLAQSKLPNFIKQVRNSPQSGDEWLDAKEQLYREITSLQQKLYSLQSIDKRTEISAHLDVVKTLLLKIDPVEEGDDFEINPNVEALELKIKGSEHENGLAAYIGDLQLGNQEYELTEEDKKNPLFKTCGELVLNFVEIMPHNLLTKALFKFDNVKKMPAESIGKIVIKQANQWTLLKLINVGAELGLPNLADGKGDWFGTDGHRRFVRGKWVEIEARERVEADPEYKMENGKHYHFEKDPVQKFPFHFATKPEEIEALNIAMQMSDEDLQNKLMETFRKKVEESVHNSIIGYFINIYEKARGVTKLQVDRIHAHRKKLNELEKAGKLTMRQRLDKKIYFFFTQFVLKPDRYVAYLEKLYADETSTLRKFCDLVSKLIDLILYPVSIIFYKGINLYTRHLSTTALNTVHMEINKNFLFESVDMLLYSIRDYGLESFKTIRTWKSLAKL